ncbi:MAG: ribose-phosphate pyrophosphokinase [Candidatus Levybacteria bacterium]|nr:ribose-phosphate pyrophosphokinase [Candidatus Levybacteria bacterium]
MKIFSGRANKPLAEKIAHKLGLRLSPIELHVFPDGEQRVMLEESVVNEHVVIVQSTGIPTDKNYMELFFIIDAARRNGAKSVTVVIPYIGYQRQDHVFRDGEARSLEVVIRFMEQAGGTRFISVDTHTIKVPELFIKPFVHISALPLFAKRIMEEGLDDNDSVLVSPDMGGGRRIKQLSGMLSGMPYAAIEKNRDLKSGNVRADIIHGKVHKRAIIVDDMISSGGTIVTACKLLKKKGVKEMYVFATHPVFSERAPELLQESFARKIYVTDTIFVSKFSQFPKLEILSVADVIAEQIKYE